MAANPTPSRLRAATQTARSAPWRRAPLLLRRRPGVMATVAAATGLVAASMASVPLFLSSVGSGAVNEQVRTRCAPDTGVTWNLDADAELVAGRGDDPFAPLDGEGLQPSRRWVRTGQDQVILDAAADADSPDEVAQAVYLISRDDALDHVEIVEGDPDAAGGLWINDTAARIGGLAVGDTTAVIHDSDPVRSAAVTVAGIYRDVAGPTLGDYWCSQADIALPVGADLEPPPPMVIVDDVTFADLMKEIGIERVAGQWEAALDPDLTRTDVGALSAELGCRGPTVGALSWCRDGRPTLGDGVWTTADPYTAAESDVFVEDAFDSHLPFVGERAGATQTAVRGGVLPLALFATLAGVGLVCASASMWFDRRRREVRLLAVRGVSPVGLGAKAALELILPLLGGTAVGVAAAWLLVRWFGPSTIIEGSAVQRAVLLGVVALAASAATIVALVTARARFGEVRRSRASWFRWVPYELALVALTVFSFQRLESWGVPISSGAETTRIDLWGLMFPVLFLVTVVAVVARLQALALHPARRISRTWPIAWFLGVRRLDRSRVAVVALSAAAAISAGVLCDASTFGRSLDATLVAKIETYVGSQTAVQLAYRQEPPDVSAPSTAVEAHRFGWIGADRDQKMRVKAIDPETFADAAFWDPTFAEQSLDEIVELLAEPSDPGTVRAVVAGATVDAPVDAGISDGAAVTFTLVPVAEVEAFPGMSRAEPTMFTTVAALDALDAQRDGTELWIDAPRDETLAELDALGVDYLEVRNGDTVADGLSFLTVSWTFGYIEALGMLAGLLVIAGTAIYLDARRRDRVLGYAFARRMGMSSGQHRRALLLELVASVTIGCWVGLVTATVAVWIAHDHVDPIPIYEPAPLFRPATGVLVAVGVLAVVVAVGGAVLAQRRVDRDDPVEVLRAGT